MYDICKIIKRCVKSNLDEKQYYYAEEIISKLYVIITGVRNRISISFKTTVNNIQL